MERLDGYLTWFLLMFIPVALQSLWGAAVSAMAKNRRTGFKPAKWFWLGFFFGIIAMAAALSKPRMEGREDDIFENMDRLLRYKQLLEAGAITQEEFDRKKRELLDL